VVVVGAIPSSGLDANAPLLAKIVGLIAAGLSALNYTAQRSSLKRTVYTANIARLPSKTGGAS
jgi:hypothetical protein